MKLNGIEVNEAAELAPQQDDTRWFGPPAYIAYENRPDALLVYVTKRRRKADVAIAAAIGLSGAVCFVLPEVRPFGFGLLLAAAIYLFNALHATGTVMTVNQDGLWSEFTGRVLRKRASVTWDKAGRLTYLTQTRNRPRGLYAKRSFVSYTCLIPYVNAEQVKEVSNKIYDRFPQYRAIA